MRSILLATAALTLLAACSDSEPAETTDVDVVSDTMSPKGAQPGNIVNAMLKDGEGNDVGEAIVASTEGGLQVNVSLKNLPAGAHGIHVHETGECTAPDFKSAGGHWNPTDAEHGLEDPKGHHYGDMPNVTVADDGTASFEYMIDGGTIDGENPLMDDDGAAIVVHEGADDGTTQPSGDSGARIACGVFEVRESVASE